MTIRPTAYLVMPENGGDSRVQLVEDAAPINVLSDNIVPLFTRSQIAPLCAPVVDQHGKVAGSENRRPGDLLTAIVDFLDSHAHGPDGSDDMMVDARTFLDTARPAVRSETAA